MNVVFTGNFLGTGWDGSIADENNVADALEKLGHTVFKIQREDHTELPDFNGIGKRIDFVLIAQYNQYPDDWVIRLRDKYQCPVVYWVWDYQADGQAWHENIVRVADLYLSKRIADNKYHNWRWACDFAPDFLLPAQNQQKSIDVLFTGSYLPWATERIETLKLIDQHFNLVVHSVTPDAWKQVGLKNVNDPVMDHALPALVAKAKINLAIDHTLEAGYWSDRAAQVLACGGFVLHRWIPLLESYFHSNIAYFYSKDDCLEALQYWLEHDEDREVIAAEGYQNSPYYKAKERVADVLNIIRNEL